MRELRTEPLILRDAAHPKSRLRVTWEHSPGWFARLFGAGPLEVSAIYEGTGTQWYMYEGKPTLWSNPEQQPVERDLAQLLSGIEARLLNVGDPD